MWITVRIQQEDSQMMLYLKSESTIKLFYWVEQKNVYIFSNFWTFVVSECKLEKAHDKQTSVWHA